MSKIKICGLSRPCDIDFVNTVRPDWCGFILCFPTSRRNVSPGQAAALRAHLDPAITPVGVFVDQPTELVAKLLLGGVVSVAQLHGHEDAGYISALRSLAPGYPVWQAFRLRRPEDARAAMDSPADLVVLDSGQGSGQTFDWSLTTGVTRPFLLAGGLTPDNLPAALRAVHPYGVDLSSGVETRGYKDLQKMKRAAAAAREE